MFEKVNPAHPDKIADRIAGALVDLAYTQEKNPKIAVEVLIGHGICHIVTETSTHLALEDVQEIVSRIAGDGIAIDYQEAEQDPILAGNQSKKIRCGDNGIFRGVPVTDEQRRLSDIARIIYGQYQCDGKYIADGSRLIICQSNAVDTDLAALYPDAEINPLGYWTGGTNPSNRLVLSARRPPLPWRQHLQQYRLRPLQQAKHWWIWQSKVQHTRTLY